MSHRYQCCCFSSLPFPFPTDAQYYGVNLFCELDVEGEYWIDKVKGLLYFIPPGGNPGAAEVFLSLANNAITVSNTADTLSHVTFNGLNVNYARTIGIYIPSANAVSVLNVNASNNGHTGISIGGTNNVISNVAVTGTGCTAVSLGGGDLTTLSSGNNTLRDSKIWKYARMMRTYNPGMCVLI